MAHGSPKAAAAAERALAAVAHAGGPRLRAFCGYGAAAAAAGGGGAGADGSSGSSNLPSVRAALLSAAELYGSEGWDTLRAAALELSALRGPATGFDQAVTASSAASGHGDEAAGGLSPATAAEPPLEPPIRVVEWRFYGEAGCHVLPLALDTAAGTAAAAAAAAGAPPPLVVGAPSLLTAQLQATESLDILGAAFEPPPSSALQAMNELAEQLPPGVAPATLSAGASLYLTLRLMPTRTTEMAGSGCLRISWRSSSGDASESVSESVVYLPLPPVAIVNASISARVLCPPEARAGTAFSIAVALNNASGEAQDVSVSLPDAPGFLVGGERTVTLALPPRERGVASFKLVAAAAGRHQLPRVLCACPRLQCTLATTASHITVL